MTERGYNQFCPIARALDILGERWTLLIVRNLLIGPLRYRDLLDTMPGIGTNLLAARLRKLEKEGIIARRKLPPPAGSTVYELTELGRGLEEPLLGFARWGLWTLSVPASDPQFRPLWSVAGLKILFLPEAARGLRQVYQYQLDGEVFHAVVDDGDLQVGQGPAPRPDLVFTSDGDTWMSIASGSLTPEQALMSGRVTVEGDSAALMHHRKIFPLPSDIARVVG